MTVLSTEELCWGDAGLYLSTPNSGLGGAAVMAAGLLMARQTPSLPRDSNVIVVPAELEPVTMW